MAKKDKPPLDPATINVIKRVLATPPKKNEDLKVGRSNKGRSPKDRASSSKPRTA